MLRREGIRALIREHGPEGYLKIQALMLGMDDRGRVPRDPVTGRSRFRESVKLPSGREVPRRRPRDFSVKAMWEGMVGPVEETLPSFMAGDQVGLVEVPKRFREAVSSGLFPQAVGQLIATEVIEAYEMTEGFIGDELVRPLQSQHRGERVVGFTASQGPKEVAEEQPYEDSTIGEKSVGTRETKRGRIINVSEESVFFDQTGQVLDRAQGIGEAARQDRERRIVQGVIDHSSANAIYQPDGTAEQLYQASNNNVDTATGALQDWTDIQAVMAFHAANVTDDRETDDEGGPQPLVWVPRILLTGMELAGDAARIVAATAFGGGATDTVSANPLSFLLPGGSMLRALASPFIDVATSGDQWDDASDWLLGDFQKQFRYKTIWPLQTFRAPAQNDEQFERDVLARLKVREYGDVIAIDERWVIKVDVV